MPRNRIYLFQKEDSGICTCWYWQWSEYSYPWEGWTGYKRRTERWSSCRSKCCTSSDFPETGYEYFLHCASYICTGGTGWYCPYQHSGWRCGIWSEAGNSDRYKNPSEGKRCSILKKQERTWRSLCDIRCTGSDQSQRRSKRSAA